MSVLMHASNQWANRPADERFSSLQALDEAVRQYRSISVEAPHVNLKSLRAAVGYSDESGKVSVLSPTDPRNLASQLEPVIVGASGVPAQFSHYSFGQFARRLGAPASYLRGLPAPLAVANLNNGIQTTEVGDDDNLLFAQNGGLRLRATVSDKYTRIWNSDITSRLIALTEKSPEWQPAPAAFDGSRGLYASDADMFAFLVDNDRRIFETGPGGGLGRGFFVWNSEVGAASFGIMTFFYEYVCGNHRVWGASGVQELKIRHVGTADERAFSQLAVELKKYADSSSQDDELKVASMRRMELGGTKEEVLDRVFGLRTGLTQGLLANAYETAVKEEAKYGNPRSVWGFTGGLTQIARDMPNTADRVATDKAAGKIMQIAF